MWVTTLPATAGSAWALNPPDGPEDTITQANIHSVTYRESRQEFSIHKFMGDALELKNSLRSLSNVKHIGWQHEKEWRYINEAPNQLVHYDPSALKEVFLGARATEENAAKLHAACDQRAGSHELI